jgi:hypothetical protein
MDKISMMKLSGVFDFAGKPYVIIQMDVYNFFHEERRPPGKAARLLIVREN